MCVCVCVCVPLKASICFWMPVCIHKSNISSTYSSAFSMVTICKHTHSLSQSVHTFIIIIITDDVISSQMGSYLIVSVWFQIHS